MKVLIAEDDQIFRMMLGRALSNWGYEVVTASDGEEALRQIHSKGGPQFAILDWMMPNMDGLEVCRRVRSVNFPSYVYIILLTANQGANLVSGFEAGVDDYLFKPVNLDELKLRLRAGRRVLDAGQWYRSIAETASDGIVILHNQVVVFANGAAGTIFGYEKDEMFGREFSSLVSGANLPERPDLELAKSHAGGGGAAPIEIAGKHRSGRDIVLEVSLSEFAPLDQSNHLTAVIRDVTHRKSLEAQRAQAYKMESIGQLAAGVAHEINTPIQYIGDNVAFVQKSYQKLELLLKAYSELLGDVRRTPGAQSHIERIEKLTARINLPYLTREAPRAIEQSLDGVAQVASIVTAMKDFSHPGSAEMAPADLNHLIESAVLISKNTWKYVADLQTDLDLNLPLAICSPGELRQVLLNLIVNAADAVSDALKLSFEQKGLIRVSSRWDGQMAEIRVSDSGTGIPAAIRAKVFELFFTTKEVGKGSGQGLALAYSVIVKRHAGSIVFESEAGLGTTFILRLPLAGAGGNSKAAEPANAYSELLT